MNIILSPHFDDAVLSLGGLVAQEGSNTLVATFFAGAPPTPLVRRWDTMCGFADSGEAIRARTEENKKSLNGFGVTDDRIRNYVHLDVEYRFNRDDKKVPEPELVDAIRKEIESLLREFASDSLKIFIPGFAVHTDHALMKDAALAVARTLPQKSTCQFFFYQDIPYVFKISEIERLHKITQGSFSVSPHIIPLTREDMEKKLAGVALYASQVDHLGDNVLEKIEQFAAAQSQSLSLSAQYCEVTYQYAPLLSFQCLQ